MRTASDSKEEKTYSIGLMEQSRLFVKLGCSISLFLVFGGAIWVIRAMFFESFNQVPLSITFRHGTVHSFINIDLFIFLLGVSMTLTVMGIGNPKINKEPWEVRTGWGIMFGGTTMVSFFHWLFMIDGIFEIFIYTVSLCCSLYAFFIFRKHLKNTVLSNS